MAGSTRDRLIQSAMDLFYRHGFHAVGLDRILAEVGVTKTTFYNHFESKDDLVLAVIRRRDEWERQRFAEGMRAIGGESPRGQLLALFDVLDTWFNDGEFRGCIFINAAAEFPSPHDPAHLAAAKHLQLFEAFLHRLAEEAGAEEPQVLAEELAMIVEGAIISRYVVGNVHAAQTARPIAELLVDRNLPQELPV